MITVVKDKVDDYELRVEIYMEIIRLIESEKLLVVRFLRGEDDAFDEAIKKVHSK